MEASSSRRGMKRHCWFSGSPGKERAGEPELAQVREDLAGLVRKCRERKER